MEEGSKIFSHNKNNSNLHVRIWFQWTLQKPPDYFILGWDAPISGVEGNGLLMMAAMYKNQHRTWDN